MDPSILFLFVNFDVCRIERSGGRHCQEVARDRAKEVVFFCSVNVAAREGRSMEMKKFVF